MGRITDTVKTLLILNVIFFVSKFFLSEGLADGLFALWFPKHSNFHFWQVVTHMFMHGGTTHLFFNMFALYMFGSHIENALGKNRFLFLYFSAGFGAVLLQLGYLYYSFIPGYQLYLNMGMDDLQIFKFIEESLSNGNFPVYEGIPVEQTTKMFTAYNTSMVGASGAIFGVLVAFAVLYPNLPLMLMFIPFPIKAKYLIGGYFLLDVYAALSGNNIIGPANTANWAHIGGAIVGFIIIWYWKKNWFNDKRLY